MILKITEKQIETSIIDFLWLKGIFCWKNNTVGVYDPKRKQYRKQSKYAINGVSDILGVLPDGKFLAIEVKTEKKYPSPNQREFIQNIFKNNGVVFVARSISDVEKSMGEYLK